MNICVFGSSSNAINENYIQLTEQLGSVMAERGHAMVFGAGTHGLMGAAARGMKRCGGKIIGVIPEFFRDEAVEVIYTDCDELIYTDSMRERKRIMEDLSDAFIITPGGIGTFEEFFEVLTLKQLGRHAKPIAIYNPQGYFDNLIELMENAVKEGFINRECDSLYICTDSFDTIFDYIENSEPAQFDIFKLKQG